MTYTYCKKIIENGKYDKADMMNKLDIFLLNNRITEAEYKDLFTLIKEI